MAVEYTVEGQQDGIRVEFTTLPENTVFLRVERRAVVDDTAPPPPPPQPVRQPPPTLNTGVVTRFTGLGDTLWRARLFWNNIPEVTVTVQRSPVDQSLLPTGDWTDVSVDNTSGMANDVLNTAGTYAYRLVRGTLAGEAVLVSTDGATPELVIQSVTREVSLNIWGVRLTWFNTPAMAVSLERRRNGGEWSTLISNYNRGRYNDSGSYRMPIQTGAYDYRVNLGGVFSNVVTVEIGEAPPSLSVSTSVSGTDLTSVLRWENSPVVTVNVERRTGGGDWSEVSTSNNTGTYTDTASIAGGEIYSYRLVLDGRPGEPVVAEVAPVDPVIPASEVDAFKDFTRDVVTGMEMNGEVFNLPRIRGNIRGADGDSDGRIWVIETRNVLGVTATVVLRYNPVSGQGWLFTVPGIPAPVDVATSDTELFVASGRTVSVFFKPSTVTDNAPGGVLRRKRTFTLPGDIVGLAVFNDVLYANIGGNISGYAVSDGSLQGSFASMPNPSGSDTDYTISFGAAGVFAAVRGAANPVAVWHYIPDNPGGAIWRVHQTSLERRVNAIAVVDDGVLVVNRDAGLITPYRVFRHPVLDGYTDSFAPLGVDFEYRVGALGFGLDYEIGEWVK